MISRIVLNQILKQLSKLQHGVLTMQFPDGKKMKFGAVGLGPNATLKIHSESVFFDLALGGDIAFAEAFMQRKWETDNLTDLIKLFLLNKMNSDIQPKFSGINFLKKIVDSLYKLSRINTISNSKKNIARHYDLSNKMFSLFLDPTMMYSCGVFEHPDDSLEKSQIQKVHKLIDKAKISENDHVLEIGCGWGTFAIEAVKKTGCKVSAVTISKEQYELARQRCVEAGVQDRVEIIFQDYRNIEGQFDRIVSIEMLEAVGHAGIKTFFKKCNTLLKQDGLMVLQVITIPDQRYEGYRRSFDFIRKYIFPGGLLPSVNIMSSVMTKFSSLHIEHLENIGVHYARTLYEWRKNFNANLDQVKMLGFDQNFIRMWNYYLSSCEAAFSTRWINDVQLVITRIGNKNLPLAPYVSGS